MKEKTLLKIASVCSILGLFSLYLLSDTLDLSESTIQDLDEKIGDDAIVTGIVKSVREYNETTFVKIAKEETITVVLFERVPGIQIGDVVQVRGTVELYKGKTELLGEEMRIIR